MLTSRAIVAVAAAVGLLALAVTGSAHAESTGTGVSTSKSPHNFADNFCMDATSTAVACAETTGAGNWNPNAELCGVCHQPHGDGTPRKVLWNHADSLEAAYTIYDAAWSSTIDGVTSQPTGLAKNCLGCHDGTVGVDAFGATAGPGDVPNTGIGGGTSPYLAGKRVPKDGGTDLTGQHPISITYVDTGLNDETATAMGTSGNVQDVLEGGAGGMVQCSSCHDVHDEEVYAAGQNTYLLRATNAGSALCVTCHNK